MIEFDSLAPSYSSETTINSVDGLRDLGCSETLIANILIGDGSSYRPIVEPEEWFWADPERFGAGGPWVDELYRLTGGGFINLPFQQQATLLGLPVECICKKKVPLKRGRWLLRAGRDGSIEEAALEEILKPDEHGFYAEGDYLAMLHSMAVQVARSAFKQDFDLDQASRVTCQTEKHRKQMLDALALFLGNREKLLEALWQRSGGAFSHRPSITLESLSKYIDLAGIEFLSRIMTHYIKHSLHGAGHPDLTLIGPGGVRFVEVKGEDRLRGTQATWIRNVARPLGLDVTVVQVTAHD